MNDAPLNPAQMCSVAGCGSAFHARGLCARHYQRWKKYGHTELPSALDRFLAKVERDGTGCWIWNGYINPGGYGQFGDAGKVYLAHRWAWEHFNGSIPSDRPHLDHLCRTRRCVNPTHLEPVTQTENTRRGMPFRRPQATRRRCPRGHVMDEANSYRRTGRRNSFACRKCMVLHQRAYVARKKAGAR